MATTAPPGIIVNLSDSWGPILTAVFISLTFYGVSILQTFFYYERYTQDSIALKSLVAWVFALDTAHTILLCVGVWQPFIQHFGDGNFLLYTHAPLLISIILASVVSTTVQSFFIHRIWLLTKNNLKWLFPLLLMPFVIAQLVLGSLYAAVALVPYTTVAVYSEPLLTKVALALDGAAAGVDVIITISLCTLLALGRTGFQSTDRMLNRLIFITVNTGLSSALFAFAASILLAVYPDSLIFTALYYPLCSVYCNTLLASLNARSFVRGSNVQSHYVSEPSYGQLELTTLVRIPNPHRSSRRNSRTLEAVRSSPLHTTLASESRWPPSNYDCWIGEMPGKSHRPTFTPANNMNEMA